MTYIDPRGKALAHLDRLAAWQRGEKPAPVTVELDLSNRCILGCQSCHFAHTHTRGPWVSRDRRLPMLHDKGGDLMDLSLALRVLEEMRAAGVESVIFSGGGEPTTHPFWLTAVEAAQSVGLEVGMYTLGGLLTEASARALASAATWVVVSLDAANAETYSREKGVPSSRFEAACNGIGWLSGVSATVGVSYLLHAVNHEHMPQMLALARSLGADYTTFRPTVETSPAGPSRPLGDRAWVTLALPMLRQMAMLPDVEVDPQRFIEWRDWESHPYRACYGIRLNTTITPDGRVWVCPNRREFAGASCLGDLRVESFADIWARHPGQWTDFADCRAMCRLHAVNQTLSQVMAPRKHEAFI